MEKIIIRELEESDLDNGFLECLDNLRSASSTTTPEIAKRLFHEISSDPDYHILVALLNGQVVCTGTIIIKKKFTHGGKGIGFLEDLVTMRGYEGQGISSKIMNVLLEIARKNDCYKTQLNCPPALRHFYEKLKFIKYQDTMRFDHVGNQ